MLRCIFLCFSICIFSLTPVFSQEGGKYSIKTMTSEVQQALDGRKNRFSQLRDLKEVGYVGENNRGYVEALKEEIQVNSVVEAENKDRSVIYNTIAQQNDLEGQLAIIESAFAAIKRDRANPGEKIQTEDGRWVAK